MIRTRSLSRASTLLLLVAILLLLASTSEVPSLGLGLSFSSQGTNHGKIPQLGSQPDFQMQLVPNQFLAKYGTGANISIYFTPINNFSGIVSLSGNVSPTGSSSPTIRLPASAKVNWTISGIPHYFVIVNTTTASPLGLYTITVYGVSGSVSHTSTTTLGVTDVSVPSNGAELVYRGAFSAMSYPDSPTTLNNTFEDLGYVTIGIWDITLSATFGTFRDTGGIHTLSPYEEKTAPLTFAIPANTSPGNYTVTVTIRWYLGPGTIYQTSGPDLVTHSSVIVYSNGLGLPNLQGLTPVLLGILGGVAASAAIMFALLSVMEKRRKDPFQGLSTSPASLHPRASMKICHYCGAATPLAEFCAECGSRLS